MGRPAASGLDSFCGLLAAIECDSPGSGATRVSYYQYANLDALTQTCAGQAGAPVLTWTYEPLLAMGRADGTDSKALTDWWRGYHGYAPPGHPLSPACVAWFGRCEAGAVRSFLLGSVPGCDDRLGVVALVELVVHCHFCSAWQSRSI